MFSFSFKNLMKEFKEFFVKNTPEAALLGALIADFAGFQSGAITPHDAVLAAVTALVAFGFAESGKDGQETSAAIAASPTPPAQPAPVAPVQ